MSTMSVWEFKAYIPDSLRYFQTYMMFQFRFIGKKGLYLIYIHTVLIRFRGNLSIMRKNFVFTRMWEICWRKNLKKPTIRWSRLTKRRRENNHIRHQIKHARSNYYRKALHYGIEQFQKAVYRTFALC